MLVRGSIAYCSQSPWIGLNEPIALSGQVPLTCPAVNATLRDNILFGKPFDYTRYHEVIKACALEEDLKILMYGDATEIGEKGGMWHSFNPRLRSCFLMCEIISQFVRRTTS